MTLKTVGPRESDAEMSIVIPGLDTPKWDANMSHWLRFDVDPPPLTYPNSKAQRPKRVQPKVRRMRWWKNPRVFFNPNYKCAAGTPIVSGEIDNA